MCAKKTPEGLEVSMKKLETIVADLEEGEFSLDKALEKFEEGLKLGKTCRQMLEKAELRVKKLVENKDGELEEQEFDGEL